MGDRQGNIPGGTPTTKADILKGEYDCIRKRRRVAFQKANGEAETQSAVENPKRTTRPSNVVGLALSGGGLRSAMFNDGFLQGLSHRGLLRYVDYLCSVSGGGYIASHLATRRPKDPIKSPQETSEINESRNFHENPKFESSELDSKDQNGSQEMPSWYLGREPNTGKRDVDRMRGVGRYLTGFLSLAPSLVFSMLSNALIYLALCGIVATLLALFWRSFDHPDFRFLLLRVLQFQYGGEFLIAFYPVILIVILGPAALVIRSACFWGSRVLVRENTGSANKLNTILLNGIPDFRKIVQFWMQYGLITLGFSIVVSIAVFTGNAQMEFSQSQQELTRLSDYGQMLALIAAGIQILVFLGRERLFQSELDEAKRWQKVSQIVITHGAILILVVAMIHWMAKEDISRFNELRPDYLVMEDVLDWPVADRIFQEYDPTHSSNEKEPEFLRDRFESAERSRWFIADPWRQHLADGLLTNGKDSLSLQAKPPSPLLVSKEPRGLLRYLGAVEAYCRANLWMDVALCPGLSEKLQFWKSDGEDRSLIVERWNKKLEDPGLMTHLLVTLGGTEGKLRTEKITKSNVDSNVEKSKRTLNEMTISQRFGQATINRNLFHALAPGVIRKKDVASTLIVPPYDQRARWAWLVSWVGVLGVGLLCNRMVGRFISVYGFYRSRLRRFFHGGLDDIALSNLTSTDYGLPHPLFLAAKMTPVRSKGGYQVATEPFVFSSIYCGDLEKHCYHPDSLTYCGKHEKLMLSDAVTLSGAAVTPLMSHNWCLSMVLSFFGSELGKWIYFSKPVKDRDDEEMFGSEFFVLLATVTILFLLAYSELLTWTSSILMMFSALMIVLSIKKPDGPILLLTSILCLNRHREPRSNGSQETRIHSENSREEDPTYADKDRDHLVGHIADGGFFDYLGTFELLRRRCSIVIVSDAGAHLNGDSLAPLAKLCEMASANLGIRILDLDHGGPIDFGRLGIDEDRMVHQPFLCARIQYPPELSIDADGSSDQEPEFGLLIYCQMAITEDDPLEIQQIRHRFPSFPDEPTSNQFYTDEQVSAYSQLGYHIAERLCVEMHRWDADVIHKAINNIEVGHPENIEDGQPLFSTVQQRLTTAFRLACFQEKKYNDNDIFSEAIWPSRKGCTPSSAAAHQRLRSRARIASKQALEFLESRECSMKEGSKELTSKEILEEWRSNELPEELPLTESLVEFWLNQYETNADLRTEYRNAVTGDINAISDDVRSQCCELYSRIAIGFPIVGDPDGQHDIEGWYESLQGERLLMASHLALIAVASQEIHYGRPGNTFQIGGRQKLIELAISLADVILVGAYAGSGDLNRLSKNCIGEILEMRWCTFVGSEHLAVVSFSQCMMTMWGSLARHRLKNKYPQEYEFQQVLRQELKNIKTVAQEVYDQGNELASAQCRILLDRSLREQDTYELVQTLEKVWCIAFSYAAEPLATAPKEKNSVSTKPVSVKAR